jgi:UPF0755 protein
MKKIYYILYFLTIFLLIFLGFLYKELLFNDNTINEIILFEIEEGETLKTVTKKLKEQGLIDHEALFYYYFYFKECPEEIKAGLYNFNTKMTPFQISNKIIEGNYITEKITILEGWTINDISDYLENKEICTRQEFLSAINKDYSYSFIKDGNLEGFLFPDTYYISLNDGATEIIEMMLNNFQDQLPENTSNKTIYEIITMASILEKEVITEEDKAMVAGLLWKRLEYGMPLQVDATVIYAKKEGNDLYNTYSYKGLPIGPISNPGLDSIVAAMNPIENEYWYYLSANDGTTIFSRDFEEHKQNKWTYLR